MKNKDFCHLHLHDEYSALDGYGTAEGFAKKAKEIGFEYLALTNHGNIDGLINFQKACQTQGITPILGCEGYIVPTRNSKQKSAHILLLVKNQVGFNNLCKNLTFANKLNFYYKPRFSFEFFLNNCEGLIVATACVASFVRQFKEGKEFFYQLLDAIKDDLYCEIMPHNISEQIKCNEVMVGLAKENKCKVIATNDCHYISRLDWKVHEVLLAVQTKQKWNDPKRWKFPVHGLHLKTAKEMRASLNKIGFYRKEYLINTIEIAEKCSGYLVPKREIELPKIKKTKREEDTLLLSVCNDSLDKKVKNKGRVAKIRYSYRLKEEYDLILKKKFSGYFLIVWKLVDWCRKNNILIGPGRGSVGGSLIAYLLGITSIDPIENSLLFSRFINMDRIDYPDIDIDFEDSKRGLVKQYLESTYGQGNVAGVSSFNRMKSKAVIKDVGRVFGVPHNEVNSFTKHIDDHHPGDQNSIDAAVKNTEEGAYFNSKYPNVINVAKKLEGQIRNPSKHAAALILSRQLIGEVDGRCNLSKRGEDFLVNWEKNDSEFVGLMKLDVLGLKLLSILSETLRIISENEGVKINLEKINYNDKRVLDDINKGHTVGLFQLSAWATTELIKKIKIDCFEDLCDIISLVRPGPTNSGMTAQYIKRKKGAPWDKKHRIYEKITKDTFGLLIYQEQVMEVIRQVAGLPYSLADKIRKIIGKKRDPKEFQKYETTFLNGCRKTKFFNPKEAKEFWNGLQEWSLYGFNKAHSVGYAILGMWSAFLKTYYPTEFICASLTFGAKDKKGALIEEAYRLGLSLNLPKVGVSEPITWVANKGRLFIPFVEIKGVGDIKAQQIAIPVPNKMLSFFEDKEVNSYNRFGGAIGKLLDEIGVYDTEQKKGQISEKVKSYFDFRVVSNPKETYKNLYLSFNNQLRLDKINDAINGDVNIIKKANTHRRLIKNKRYRNEFISCSKCDLINECRNPIPSRPGKKNIFIVGEAPTKLENEKQSLFVGKAGKVLWGSLKKYDKKNFHLTSIVKCFPGSKKINKKQVNLCGNLFLKKEIERVKPKIILAFGNTSLLYFTGEPKGIIKMTGKVLWNEMFSCWVVYCVNPISTLYNEDNLSFYKKGVGSFKRIMKAVDIK